MEQGPTLLRWMGRKRLRDRAQAISRDQNRSANSQSTQQLSSPEIERIKSETARNKAECQKLLQEGEEIRKRSRHRLPDTALHAFKAVVWGAVAAGLFTAWYTTLFAP